MYRLSRYRAAEFGTSDGKPLNRVPGSPYFYVKFALFMERERKIEGVQPPLLSNLAGESSPTGLILAPRQTRYSK